MELPVWDGVGPALSQLDTALEMYNLGCSSTHHQSLQVLQRTAFGPAPRKAGWSYVYFLKNILSQKIMEQYTLTSIYLKKKY
jgi:hypothetical protein